ncbi:hypothetical protein NMY22_g18869 [Coprinellus aureogranulatus]|nr:hypothetical protein NMY22_g18869 [Coprinellus aureogranulatus]
MSALADWFSGKYLAKRISEWDKTAPSLERLTLFMLRTDIAGVPQSLLQGKMPALRQLALSGCMLQWSSLPSIPTLTHLFLEEYELSGRPRSSTGAFATSLGNMRKLEKLVLVHCIPLAQGRSQAAPVLRSLKVLSLRDWPKALANFFNLIQVPCLTTNKIIMTGAHLDQAGDIDNVLSELLSPLKQLRETPIPVFDLRVQGTQFLSTLPSTPSASSSPSHLSISSRPPYQWEYIQLYL